MRYSQCLCGCLIFLLSCLFWLGGSFPDPSAAAQAVDFSAEPVQTIKIDLGTVDNQLKFVNDQLALKTGIPYKLVLQNPSELKHYFTAKSFADASWTQKVEAGHVEVKGAIHELELKPNAVAEWFFIPMKPGQYELHCSIPGHTEAGMIGTITITS